MTHSPEAGSSSEQGTLTPERVAELREMMVLVAEPGLVPPKPDADGGDYLDAILPIQ